MLEYNNIYGGTRDEGFADVFSRSAKDWSIVKENVMRPYTEGLFIHNLHAKCFRVIATE